MTVVKELDSNLFKAYTKPKAAILTQIIRGGILDPAMDWYDTPQPSGKTILAFLCLDSAMNGMLILDKQRFGRICLRLLCSWSGYIRRS
jgi:hypothetical protein